jgi:hypothetical protein
MIAMIAMIAMIERIERIVIVPRWAGGPSNDWYPWVRGELARSHPQLRVDVELQTVTRR